MKKISRLDYAYAVGRVRALEKKLISRDVFLESAEEEDFLSATKVIFDAGYFLEEMEEIKDTKELDIFLKKEKESLVKDMFGLCLEQKIMKVIEEEYCPEDALKTARETGYPFIIDYVRHRIDLGNLKILARIKYLDLPQDKLKTIIIDGGFIEGEKILKSYALSYFDISESLKLSPYFEAWSNGIDALQENETFVTLEREFENYLMRYLRNASYIVFGPEPVFAYVLAKKKELHLFRIIGVG
ncbi:V-type ATPase subunit, partial [Candidatus Babeliales bacterium]|nr:V-type ATPase subunit [Candidatus Babeliales bacterium]